MLYHVSEQGNDDTRFLESQNAACSKGCDFARQVNAIDHQLSKPADDCSGRYNRGNNGTVHITIVCMNIMFCLTHS